MADIFYFGGTNKTTQVYKNPTGVNTSGREIRNTSSGKLLFESGAKTDNTIFYNMVNSGLVSVVPSTKGEGSTFNLGSLSGGGVLKQTGGTIRFSQPDATSGGKVYARYDTITNDASSTIDFLSANGGTFNADFLDNLTNDGKITLASTSGKGLGASWGREGGTFKNGGLFKIDDSSGTTPANVSLKFKSIQNAGTYETNLPAGSTSTVTVSSGGGFNNSGQWKVTSSGSGGGNFQIKGGSDYKNTGTITVDNADLTIKNTISGDGGSFNLSNKANVTLNGENTGSGQTFKFSGGNNTLNVSDGRTFKGIIRGFSEGDQFVTNIPGTPSYDSNSGILTITQSDGTRYTYDVGTGYKDKFLDNENGVVTYVPCYLAGSKILTRNGEKNVESLDLGDELVTFDSASGAEVFRTVTWVGSKTVTVDPSQPDDMAGYPVRVCENALGSGLPHTDLLVTAEHCLYLNGKFIPVRMLINGRSITYDKSKRHFNVYHVEVEEHSIIIANGIFSESFLNTENHGLFRRQGNIVSIEPRKTNTWEDAAAPLGVSRDFVEPIYREIEIRAKQAGFERQSEAVVLSNDANLHLLAPSGEIIRAHRENNGRAIFFIPADVDSVRLVSNASRPSDVIGPFIDDRRYFGVLVGEILIFESSGTLILTSHLTQNNLEGWSPCHDGKSRWTTGNALLPLGERPSGSITVMAVQVMAAGPYVVNDMARQVA